MKTKIIKGGKIPEKKADCSAGAIPKAFTESGFSSFSSDEEVQIKKVILNRKMEGLKKEQFGGMVRFVLMSPSETGNNFLKMAYINLPPGAKGAPHIHLGEEGVYTIQGKCILRIDGKDHLLEEGSAFLIPPDVEHPAEVVGEKNWIAVAAYCDECPVLKRARKKEKLNYPINR